MYIEFSGDGCASSFPHTHSSQARVIGILVASTQFSFHTGMKEIDKMTWFLVIHPTSLTFRLVTVALTVSLYISSKSV